MDAMMVQSRATVPTTCLFGVRLCRRSTDNTSFGSHVNATVREFNDTLGSSASGSRHNRLQCRGRMSQVPCAEATSGSSEQASIEFEDLQGDKFWEVMNCVQPRDKMAVVICYTSKCLPCKEVKPLMKEWEAGYNGQVSFFQFALTMANKDTAIAMDIRSSPTFLVIRNGEIVFRCKGKVNVMEVKTYLDKHIC
eukprot:jgi/Picsp_1/2278/NSC_05742-R1_thioredoxin